MTSALQQLGPDGPQTTFELQKPGPILVGRGRGCTIRLVDTRVSRHQCLLTYQKGKWHVENLGSSNGTLVNGQKVTRAELLEGPARVEPIEPNESPQHVTQDSSMPNVAAAISPAASVRDRRPWEGVWIVLSLTADLLLLLILWRCL